MKEKFEEYNKQLREFKLAGRDPNVENEDDFIDDDMQQQMRRKFIQLPTSRVR